MVSTIRFRSVKAIDVGWQRSYFALFLIAVAIALIASHPRIALVVLAYTYMLFALLMWVVNRARRRPLEPHGADGPAGEIHLVPPGDGRDSPSSERAG
jgi:hypothetical protein